MVLPYLHGEYVEVLSTLCSNFPICWMVEKERSRMGDVCFLCHLECALITLPMNHPVATYTDYIVLNPAILPGKPVFKGTCISQEELYIASIYAYRLKPWIWGRCQDLS